MKLTTVLLFTAAITNLIGFCINSMTYQNGLSDIKKRVLMLKDSLKKSNDLLDSLSSLTKTNRSVLSRHRTELLLGSSSSSLLALDNSELSQSLADITKSIAEYDDSLSNICSGVELVGPKKTVRIPLSSNITEIANIVQSVGLVFERNTPKALGKYHAVDTTIELKYINDKYIHKEVKSFNFTDGILSEIITERVFPKDVAVATWLELSSPPHIIYCKKHKITLGLSIVKYDFYTLSSIATISRRDK